MRKVPETIVFQELGSFETLGSKLSHGTSWKFADVRTHLRKVFQKTLFSIKKAHHFGEHFFDLIASGLLLFEMVVSSYHPCRILMMRKLQLRLVC